MPVPPRGSVYLEKDNLLMGETTADYRAFLQSQGMVFTDREREPEDQFGLMLLACSDLLAQGDNVAANRLLEAHLLPRDSAIWNCCNAIPLAPSMPGLPS